MQKTIYTPAYRKLIERLRNRRRALGLSQRDVGRTVGHHRTWVSRVELCDLTLDPVQLVEICRVMDLSASKLVRKLEGELPEVGDPKRL